MKAAKIAKGLGHVLMGLAGLTIVVGSLGIMVAEGLDVRWDIFNSWNPWNAIALIVLAPGAGAYAVAYWLEKRGDR